MRSGPIAFWADFFAVPEKTGGKITLLHDIREVLAIGLIANGKSVNSTDPADVQASVDYILAHTASLSAFTYDSMAMLTSGDIAAAHCFVGGHVFFPAPTDVKYLIPSEGATMYQENICVLATAPSKANARRFMEFYLRPEIAALTWRSSSTERRTCPRAT